MYYSLFLPQLIIINVYKCLNCLFFFISFSRLIIIILISKMKIFSFLPQLTIFYIILNYIYINYLFTFALIYIILILIRITFKLQYRLFVFYYRTYYNYNYNYYFNFLNVFNFISVAVLYCKNKYYYYILFIC